MCRKRRSDYIELDIDKIKRYYKEEKMSTNEIAEKLEKDVSSTTVKERLKENDVKLRRKGKRSLDIQKIRNLYQKGFSARQIADKMDVSKGTIYNRMKEHEIERKDQKKAVKEHNTKNYVTLLNRRGYLYWEDSITGKSIAVHRLVAVAEYGIEAVKNKDVHHKNGIKWDNRPQNLEPLEHGKHMIKHGTSSEKLLEDIKRVKKKLAKIPTVDEYREHGKYSDNAHCRRFGSWNEARNKALDLNLMRLENVKK